MKRKPTLPASPSARGSEPLDCLIEAVLAMRSPDELRALLEDLCTPAELEAIADRWRVVPLLLKGTAYREIHDRTGVSVTTVGRIARCLDLGAGGYRLAAERVLGDIKSSQN
ncbi:MAG: YerC/YecD family TrpR-related protein [Gammaproteobacteria bacterium]|nr:YerC/YecD family TrpR-related protein [Gammaproteobacteria bacterium]